MKAIFLTITSTFLSLGLFSQNVSFEDAKKVAFNFLTENKATYNIISKHHYDVSKSYSHEKEGIKYYHVINLNPSGFVVVSASNKVTPILGYSYNNSCPKTNQSPEFAWWMNQCVEQIEFINKGNLKCDQYVTDLWNHYLNETPNINRQRTINEVEPMLTTKWDQSPYYNGMCPEDPSGPMGRCVSGCVATALGQLMNYYRHPQQGVGSYTYDHPTYGTQSVDFSSHTYNWDEMGTDLTDENIEIAKLLYHIGVSVDMNYGPSGSGMYNHKGAYTLKEYFDYAEETRYYFRDSLESSFDWVDTLRMHIDNGMPTYYAGWGDTIFQSGHAFIVDGYQDTSYFHINWGWGGSADGYFNIENLTPSGADFTLLHEMIAYSLPKTNYPLNCIGSKTLTSTRGTIDDGSGPLNNYTNNQNCSWLIAPGDSVSSITLDFLKFNLDQSDVLTVYEGSDDSSPVIGVYSGDILPESITRMTDRLFLKFTSNDNITASGFLVEYITEKPSFCTQQFTTYTEPSGTVKDGSNGYDYHNETLCNWRINPTGANNILISFDYLDTEPIEDYIVLMDMANFVFIDTISGNQLPNPILVNSDDLRIIWVTSDDIRGGGWQLSYETDVVSTSEKNKFDIISLYPNPCKGKINIEIDKALIDYNVNIKDISGRIFYSENMTTSKKTIDISKLSKGMYFVELVNKTDRSIKKIILE
jgi:hypothetical protein